MRLFAAVGAAFDIETMLYPGSFVDIAASFVFDDVTYVDSDQQAARFFSDRAGVDEIIRQHRGTVPSRWEFVGGDYTTDLGLPSGHFGLLTSLYAGFVSEHCTRYMRSGGLLLANPSHGDVAMAALDPHYRLAAVVTSHKTKYVVRTTDLGAYLVPKRDVEVTRELLRRAGYGIAYTKRAFAYVFRLED